MTRPDPHTEIRLAALRSLHGANYWSRRPVTRMDVTVGAYDEISSADVPGLTDALLAAMPGLWEHRCSVGERGGFVARLRQGTYAPHVAEHVGLELQGMMGHDVAFGRARGAGRPGAYTVVLAHRHAAVGLRAAALALDVVRHAFAGTLRGVEGTLAELRALAETPDAPPPAAAVRCAVTGGGARALVRDGMARRGMEGVVADLAPAYLLEAGLPFARAEAAVILDADPRDVPARYRDPERARRLVSIVADAVPEGGTVVVPAAEPEVRARVGDAGCRVAVFSAAGPPADDASAQAAAWVRDGRIVVRAAGETADAGPLRAGEDAAAQVAAAMAVHALAEAGAAAVEG